MPYLSESSGFSGLLAITTTKETGALSRKDGRRQKTEDRWQTAEDRRKYRVYFFEGGVK